MRKELKHELKVPASADDVWEVYSSPDLPELIVQLLPSVFEKIEVVEGDGGLDTILHITFPPGSIPISYKEKFVTMDDHKRLKEVRQIEGGYLDMGCTFYMDSFHILEERHDSCVIVSKTEYEVPKELAANVEPHISIDSLAGMATAISNYVIEKNKNNECKPEGCCDDARDHCSKKEGRHEQFSDESESDCQSESDCDE